MHMTLSNFEKGITTSEFLGLHTLRLRTAIERIEERTPEQSSPFTSNHIKNIINHLLVAANEPDTGGEELLRIAGQLIGEQDPDLGTMVSQFGFYIFSSALGAIHRVSEKRNIDVTTVKEDPDIYEDLQRRHIIRHGRGGITFKRPLSNQQIVTWLINAPVK
jgi:hypothetical protein